MKRTIGTKIGTVLTLALILLVIVGVQAYRATRQLIEDSGWVTHTQEVRETIATVLGELHEAETMQRRYLLTGEADSLADYKTGAQAARERIVALQKLTADNANQQRRILTLHPLVEQRISRLAEGAKVRTEEGLEGAVRFMATQTGSRLMKQIHTVTGDMAAEESTLLRTRSTTSERSAKAALDTLMYGVPLAVIVFCIMGFFLTRNITGPLRLVTRVAERMAAGDLSVNIIDTKREDEAGLLLRAFKRMSGFQRDMAVVAEQIADGNLCVSVTPQSDRDVLGQAFACMITNLQRLTTELAEAVSILGSASSEIVTSTTQLAAAATETATGVTQTTTTVEELRQTALQSSDKAQSVADSAQKAEQVAEAGKQSTEETMKGMQHIRDGMGSIADSMAHLSEQTQAISQIIASVDDLAAQSNLLAVNAAIEAAKAGEQGKGFAVVAQEVKSLAEQSKQATDQVRTILADVQKATGGAAMATEQAGEIVASGVDQSALAGDSILGLSGSVTKAAHAAVQIAASNQQQLIGVEQVATAMASIRQSTAQNVTSAKQLETSARDLEQLGKKLKRMVKRYHA